MKNRKTSKHYPRLPENEQYFGEWLVDELSFFETSLESFALNLAMSTNDLQEMCDGKKDFTPELIERCFLALYPKRPGLARKFKELPVSFAAIKTRQEWVGTLKKIREVSPCNIWRIRLYMVKTKIDAGQWTNKDALDLIDNFFIAIAMDDALREELPISLMRLWSEMIFMFVSFGRLPDKITSKWENTLRALALESREIFMETVRLDIKYLRGELTGVTERYPTPLVASLKEQSTPDLQWLIADLSSEIERRTETGN